jgi:hypothetical protein
VAAAVAAVAAVAVVVGGLSAEFLAFFFALMLFCVRGK